MGDDLDAMSRSLQIFVEGSTVDELRRIVAELLPEARFGEMADGGVGFITDGVKGVIGKHIYESDIDFPLEEYGLVVDFANVRTPEARAANVEQTLAEALFARLESTGTLRLLYLDDLQVKRASAEPGVDR